PRKKKKAATPMNATAKLSAAWISLGSEAAASAAASVRMTITTNAALFIRQNDRCGAQISFECRARSIMQCKQRRELRGTKAIPRRRARHNATPQQRRGR